jgi:hypothetical protein
MSGIPIEDYEVHQDLPTDPTAPPAGTTATYTKAGLPYAEKPDGTVIGPTNWGVTGSVVTQAFGDTPAAGTTSDGAAPISHRHGMPVVAGASFPAQPAFGNDVPFFRTDLGRTYYYDGTRWLSEELFTLGFYAAGLDGAQALPGHTTGIWWVDHMLGFKLATNDGSNYWTIALHDQQDANGADTSRGSLNTSASTQGQYLGLSGTLGAVSSAPIFAYIAFTATGSPSAITWAYTARYRLIAT